MRVRDYTGAFEGVVSVEGAEKGRRAGKVIDDFDTRLVSFAVARGGERVDTRGVLIVFMLPEARMSTATKGGGRISNNDRKWGQREERKRRGKRDSLRGEPISVHELDELVLAMVLQNVCDIVEMRRHVTELIVRAIAEVGPVYLGEVYRQLVSRPTWHGSNPRATNISSVCQTYQRPCNVQSVSAPRA